MPAHESSRCSHACVSAGTQKKSVATDDVVRCNSSTELILGYVNPPHGYVLSHQYILLLYSKTTAEIMYGVCSSVQGLLYET